MIESRELTQEELNDIIMDAPIEETRNLILFLNDRKVSAFDFFKSKSVFSFGLVTNNRPIYFAHIIPNERNEYELFTVVNSHVKEQFSLYKYAKRSLLYALTLFNPIYATMEKINDRNMRWVTHLGFQKIYEDDHIIKFMIT